MQRTLIFLSILLFTIVADGATRKSTHALRLGETEIRVNVYENTGASVTFFAPHYNEQTAIKTAKEIIDAKGGRLVEIESFDEKGKPDRYLKFKLAGKIYTLDPNRIYTENGRRCNAAGETNAAVRAFAEELLKIILASDGKSLRDGERFIVSVHNNADVSAKAAGTQNKDLTAAAFLKAQSANSLVHGAFQQQADGVFLSNTEDDEDNFVFLSTPFYISHFAERGFNIVVQKAAAKLQSNQCTIDDGSFSVFAAQNAMQYICLEADAVTGAFRQRQMLEAVYQLMQNEKPSEKTVAEEK